MARIYWSFGVYIGYETDMTYHVTFLLSELRGSEDVSRHISFVRIEENRVSE